MTAVEQVLARRQVQGVKPQSRLATVTAVALHAAVLTAIFVVPKLAPDKPRPLKFVTAHVVPLEALGRRDPPPTKAPPRRPPPPPPAAEIPPPPPPKPQPQPVAPPPTDPEIPTLTDRERPRTAPPPPAAIPEPPPTLPVRQGSERGNPRGTAAFGAAVATLDNPDFTYSYYIDRMVALIRARWNRPGTAGEIESAVHFRILRDGTIKEVDLRSPSGDVLFDRAALRAVKDASPLPPLPVGFRQESLGVNLIVR